MKNKTKNTTKSEPFQTYHTVVAVPKNTTLSEPFQKIPHCRNREKKYHAVGYTILSEQFQEYHTVGTVPKYFRKILERKAIETPNRQVHDRPLSWLVLWAQTS
jgi:hypothetical protein